MITEENEAQETQVKNDAEETQNNEEAVKDTDTNSDEESKDFDVNSFVDTSETDMPGKKEDEEESDDEGARESDETEGSPWDMEAEEEEEESSDESDQEEESADDSAESAGDESTVNDILHKFQDLGIEASNVDELYQRVESAMQDGELYQRSRHTNKNIENWKKALSLDDKDIVYRNYLAEGASKEEAEEMTNNLENSNMLKDKSHDIRVAIRGSINRETDRIENSDREKVATQQAAEQKSVQALQDHLNETDTMFGFKMGKADQLDKIRKDQFDYIQSGSFFKEATSSPQVLNEVAWFTKHRKQITKALLNKGIQTGKEEILNEINNPTDENSQRILTPDGDTEFNANKFVSEG